MKRLVVMALPVMAAFAQQFEPFAVTEREASAKAAQWMHAQGYREKAWGAYLVGKHRLQEKGADVASQLAGLRELAGSTLRNGTPEYSVVQATLVALIQPRYHVDAAGLLPFQSHWPDEVLILLAQDPQANGEILLSMAERRDLEGARWVESARWATVHNLLVAINSPGIAARLLSGVNLSHVFCVMDRAGYPAGSGGGRGGGAYDGWGGFASGFPPAGVYDLVLSPPGDDVTVAPGRHPVYYRRVLAAIHSRKSIARSFVSSISPN